MELRSPIGQVQLCSVKINININININLKSSWLFTWL
jgi:hypothetical protein